MVELIRNQAELPNAVGRLIAAFYMDSSNCGTELPVITSLTIELKEGDTFNEEPIGGSVTCRDAFGAESVIVFTDMETVVQAVDFTYFNVKREPDI